VSSSLDTISPLDGRYKKNLEELCSFFSETALIKYRLKIEIKYLIALSKEKSIKEIKPFSKKEEKNLNNLVGHFNVTSARHVKKIEKKTNHDVKAIEYYLKEKIEKKLHPWIHFSLTSEDINNLSYTLMWKNGLKKTYLKTLIIINKKLKDLSIKYKNQSLLSLTHGQPATPTTFGKEISVFHKRLEDQIKQLETHQFYGKFSGATGTWSAQLVAYPNTDWKTFSSNFITSLGLSPNLLTTQIEPHDSIAESYHQIIRINSILLDLCRDLWSYISRGILGQKKIKGEIGSSTMPHKINPIQFENAEGNLGVSTALLNHLATKLPVSRMQRDLSDSTVIRNQGVGLGHSYLALKNIQKGLNRININKNQMSSELNKHWEVLSEAIQTVLRKSNSHDAYEKLKELTRGQFIDKTSITSFIKKLDISIKDKESLLKLTPKSYTGLASKLVDLI
tara:strand:+ start:445 stop:1794 length:1350 start_codon:yes stop_codon:yes gene_type:complete